MVLTRRVRDIVTVAALLAVPLLFLRSNLRVGQRMDDVDRVILTLSAPLQAGATGVAERARDVWTHYLFLVHLREENERLRQENSHLSAAAARAARATERADRAERLLGLRAIAPSETLAARVFARDLSPVFRVIRVRLDAGAARVGAGMPVVSPAGVVGRVERTYGTWSDVLLTVDPRSAVDVRVEPSGARGIARGLQGRNRYGCRLEYVDRDDIVRVGDRVVTSGQDGIFPKDLDLGRVSAVARRDLGLYQEVEVTPAVDFGDLEEVLVLLAPPPADDPEAGQRVREAARGLSALR